MPRVPFFRWWIPDRLKPGKRRIARWLMTEETAAKYDGAEKVSEEPAEWRDIQDVTPLGLFVPRTAPGESMREPGVARRPAICNVVRIELPLPPAPRLFLPIIRQPGSGQHRVAVPPG